MSIHKTKRQEQIRRMVIDRGEATVTELCEAFDVSEATVRRDLDELASDGMLRRVHGGAERLTPETPEPPIFHRAHEYPHLKDNIGKAAAELVADGETVFLGSGSTVLAVAQHLKSRRSLTVITNSLPVINLLANGPNISLIVPGGLLRHSEQSLIGHITEQAIKELRADKVIMGIRAVHIERGLTNEYLPETMTDRAIVRLSNEIILVADHTKFNKVAAALVAPITVVQTVVTDSQISPEKVRELRRIGIDVVVAEIPSSHPVLKAEV
jgi:DeoR/GlpR family transcriptional regulator of sugar metabolism